MKVVYVGPYDGIVVPSLNISVNRGEPVELPSDVAKGLIAGKDWEAVKEKAKEAKP